jgi:predicted transglutaminase-like cysteine proteinase
MSAKPKVIGLVAVAAVAGAVHLATPSRPPAIFAHYEKVEAASDTMRAKWSAVRDHLDIEAMVIPLKTWEDAARLNRDVNHSLLYLAEAPGEDLWQSPALTLSLGAGDCEDFAILKYAMLLKAGVPEDRLMIVIGNIATIQVAAGFMQHAFLIVYLVDGWCVMDSMFDHPIKPDDYINFTPLKGFSGEKVFWFGKQFRISDV